MGACPSQSLFAWASFPEPRSSALLHHHPRSTFVLKPATARRLSPPAPSCWRPWRTGCQSGPPWRGASCRWGAPAAVGATRRGTNTARHQHGVAPTRLSARPWHLVCARVCAAPLWRVVCANVCSTAPVRLGWLNRGPQATADVGVAPRSPPSPVHTSSHTPAPHAERQPRPRPANAPLHENMQTPQPIQTGVGRKVCL